MMKFEMLETVVLEKDLSKHGLKKGDLGTIVEMYEPDGLEVEFVAADGKTKAVLTLRTSEIQKFENYVFDRLFEKLPHSRVPAFV
jgi:hypothetical protein